MPNGRQRALLAVLGIPQWIPRAAQTRVAAPAALWRQAHGAVAVQDSDQPISQPSTHNHVTETAAVANSVQRAMPSEQGADRGAEPSQSLAVADVQRLPVAAPTVLSTVVAAERVQAADHPHNAIDLAINENAEQLAAAPRLNFRLQACEINQWVVLVNETDLQQPELRQLWHNILLAFKQPPVVHFSWPLSDGQRWQQAGGAKAALNGFLFRMGLDKRVGLMSELDDALCPDRLERLPHLSELLQQPLKKRLLWQLLKTS